MLQTLRARLAADLAAADGTPNSMVIAQSVARLISDGELVVGQRLPTVRDLARELHVSPATVSKAWGELVDLGLLTTRSRSGTTVASAETLHRTRFRTVRASVADVDHLDLSTGFPDRKLLPSLSSHLQRCADRDFPASYLDAPTLADLDEALRADWPYHVDRFVVVNGALDALDSVFREVLRFGDRVIVEDPCFPPILDLLGLYGCEPVPVAIDEFGMRPETFEAALASTPRAVVWQPRAHNPAGVTMSEQRVHELVACLDGTETIVIEDDHAYGVVDSPAVSAGAVVPARTVHIRSFSKAFGPELRLAAMSAPPELTSRLERRRLLGPGWSSRILQATLAEMLTDPDVRTEVDAAAATYAARHGRLVEWLRDRSVDVRSREGLNTWIPVASERQAVEFARLQGVIVAPGSPFMVTPSREHFVRVTVALVPESRADEVARVLMGSTSGSGSPARMVR